MKDNNSWLEGVAFIFCVILLVFITLTCINAAASYSRPLDTTCMDAESLRMRDDCNFGRSPK